MGSLTDFVSNTRLLQCVYNRLLSCEMNAQDALKRTWPSMVGVELKVFLDY